MEINTNAQILNENPSPFIMETFITPLMNLGLIPLTYSHTLLPDFTQGLHYITMEIPNGLQLNNQEMETLRNICTQDDDGQPNASYTFYFGTLMIFIPYFG